MKNLRQACRRYLEYNDNFYLEPEKMVKKKDELSACQRIPAHCRVVYRRISAAEFVEGIGIHLGGSEILFHGGAPLEPGIAAEVRVDAVKGVAPPLIAYIEVASCKPEGEGGYRIAGDIKGIRSESEPVENMVARHTGHITD